MSLIQCENCGCLDNTALTSMTSKWRPDIFDWAGIEDRTGKQLCCVCLPAKFSDGTSVEKAGVWHNKFDRIFLEKGKWFTNTEGNLEHKETGETDYRKYALAQNAL